MTTKQLFVSSQVQINLMTAVIIPEMKTGFWKDHRPAGHGNQWDDVELLVTTNNLVGPTNFMVPRNYNFVNPDFLDACSDQLLAAAQEADETATMKSVKKALIDLSRIVGGRLTDLTEAPTKANRGTNVPAGCEGKKVLESGKGLGSPEWLPMATRLVEAMAEIGATSSQTATYVSLERGSRKAKIFVNGGDELIVEEIGGDTLATLSQTDDVEETVALLQLEFTSVNTRKTTMVKGKDGVTLTKTTSGAVVRRAPVNRATMPSAAALAAANPFGFGG